MTLRPVTEILSTAEKPIPKHGPDLRAAIPLRQTALLHIVHGWGGGILRWIKDFSRGAPEWRHLIFYSRGDRNFFGQELALVDSAYPERPLALWKLTAPIRATEITHPEYSAILQNLLAGLGIEAVVASSLIGHSLEVLTTGRPTLRVLHDLYPYCPAMFGYFDGACHQCGPEKLTTCLRSNPRNECWHNSTAEDWLGLRQAYAKALLQPEVRLIAPARTVRDRFYRLYPEIAGKTCHIIAHGIDWERISGTSQPAIDQTAHPPCSSEGSPPLSGKNRKLRIVVPGRLEPHKGLQLLRDAMPQLHRQAEFLLLGCGPFGQSLADIQSITTIPDYDQADLGFHTRNFTPDCALLLSILPETFSYTLSEMAALGIPPLATKLGAFAERICHGKTGFLFTPDSQSLTALITSLANDRSPLDTVAHYLRTQPVRQVQDMVEDYRTLLPSLPAEGDRGAQEWLRLGIEKAHAQLQEKCAALEQEIRHQSIVLEESHRQAAALQQRLAQHQTRAMALEQELNALRCSNSWRLTAPLRFITMTFRAWRSWLPFPLPRLPASSSASPATAGEKPKTKSSSGHAPKAPLAGRTVNEPSLAAFAPASQTADRLSPGATEPSSREQQARLREHLGIPDAARIVLGLAPENRREAAQEFIQAAIVLANQRRDLYFLWLEEENSLPLPPRQKHHGIAGAPRRLFFEKTSYSSLSAYVSASDFLYLPTSEREALPLPAGATLGISVIHSRSELEARTI